MSSFRRTAVLFSVLVGLAVSAWSAEPIKFARTPAPSPDGREIAFSYQGDLWKVSIEGGRAQRLTVHEAYDWKPVWSPDGSEIAFSSARWGNDDVFVVPAEGGEPERLTFFSSNDEVTDWTPDGKGIVFSSRRNFYYHRMPITYVVPRRGGTPKSLLREYGKDAKVSPNGRWIVFSRGPAWWYRKHYRGSSNPDIWLYDRKQHTFRRLTDHPGYDFYPMWSPDSKWIYWVTDVDGTFNIWRMDLEGKRRTQLTFHKEDGVRAPSISRDGSVIAYERGADLYVVRTAGGKPRRLQVFAPTDPKVNLVETKTFTSKATEMAVSPDGQEIAFVVRGEIFVMPEKGGKARRVTNSPARDFQISWSPTGDTLVFVSDRNGNQDVFLAFSADTSQKSLSRTLRVRVVQLTDSPLNDFSPKFSPDGRRIAYIHYLGDLIVMDVDGGHKRKIVEGWDAPEFAWSPDGRWIAFSRNDNDFNQDVWIVPSNGGEAVNVSMHPDNDWAPVWSEDGRKLGFLSRRAGNNVDVWFVFLRKEDFEKTKEDWQEEEAAAETKKNRKKEKKSVEVRIDFQDIEKRVRRVTSLPGEETGLAISPDGKTFAFAANTDGKRDLFTIKWDGTELKRLTKNGSAPLFVHWTRDGKRLYYLSKGAIRSVGTKDGKTKSHNFKARMVIDHKAERLQKFDEAWQTLNHHFYDPHFHGCDWKAMWRKYRPLAAQAATIHDFNDVVSLMLGELNASHLGISGPARGPKVSTGMLGLWFDESYTGKGLKVAAVLPKGPCDHERSRLKPGDILTAIDGTPVSWDVNIHKLLNDKVGEKVILSVRNRDGKQREVVVRPISQRRFTDLEYDRWVREKRALVDRLSRGRIGYVHIRGMSMPSVEQFEQELYSVAHDKEALIIDVRNNGGGWTTDYMLAILAPRAHAYTIPRGGGKGYPQTRLPMYWWSKPVVTMCNEYSFSNAEIFSHAIKTLKRGKVVGAPTGGLVISTGAISLIDGATFRVPFRGWYVAGTGVNMENHGCVPDVVVWDQPGDADQHRDRQLEKAVEVMLSELDATK